MFQPIQWVFYFVSLFVVVQSHSILRTPTSWRNRESKNAPCGGGTQPTTANAESSAGQTITALWEVTAGDGNGPITLTMATTDSAAAGTFTGTQVAVTMGANGIPRTGTGQYPFTFTMPDMSACAGGTDGKSCHFQVKSTSNWYSCTTISRAGAVVAPTAAPTVTPLTPTAAPAPTNPPTATLPSSQCYVVTANDVQNTICAGLVGKTIRLRRDLTVPELVAQVEGDYSLNRNNKLVFRNGADAACGAWLAEFFCAETFPGATGCASAIGRETTMPGRTETCPNRCELAMRSCDLDPYHARAFKCDIFQGSGADVYGACPRQELLSPQRKVHLKKRLISWEPNQRYGDEVLYYGDKLSFEWALTSDSDLFQFETEAKFDACDFSNAQALTPTVVSQQNVYEWSTPTIMLEGGQQFYFGSAKVGACKTKTEMAAVTNVILQSQKFNVSVVEIPSGSVAEPIVGTTPEVIPGPDSTSPPTMKPVFITQPPTPAFVDSDATKSLIQPFVALVCGILILFRN